MLRENQKSNARRVEQAITTFGASKPVLDAKSKSIINHVVKETVRGPLAMPQGHRRRHSSTALVRINSHSLGTLIVQ